MREKYESLSLAVLRELAKARGLKKISALKKGELIEAMLAEDEREAQENRREEHKKNPAGRKEEKKDERKTEKKQEEKRTEERKLMEEKRLDESSLDSGETANGILEVMPDGYGFIRCENYLPGENDVYVSPSQIRKFNLKTGDIITGNTRIKQQQEKFSALLYISSVNGFHPSEAAHRKAFEDLTPIFPNQRLRLETNSSGVAMRIMDLVSPVGKGQRGMIVAQPKAGKTTLLKDVARSIKRNNPEMHLIILLIDERPEEVTDIKEAIEGGNTEVI
ncbi:MAG TPA: transcription termination factor Rho, partial [Candidatus Eubacterium avistercoris]|nr:transcription termination factor Rho [Candidatus Eubacterium avistercoris]